MSKYSASVYSTTPQPWRSDRSGELQRQIAEWPTVAVTEKADGDATVETFTVRYDWPVRTGLIVGPRRATKRGRPVRCEDRRALDRTRKSRVLGVGVVRWPARRAPSSRCWSSGRDDRRWPRNPARRRLKTQASITPRSSRVRRLRYWRLDIRPARTVRARDDRPAGGQRQQRLLHRIDRVVSGGAVHPRRSGRLRDRAWLRKDAAGLTGWWRRRPRNRHAPADDSAGPDRGFAFPPAAWMFGTAVGST